MFYVEHYVIRLSLFAQNFSIETSYVSNLTLINSSYTKFLCIYVI